MYWVLWCLAKIGITFTMPTRVIGKKYLKRIKKDSAILSYNHQSNYDAILLKLDVIPTAKMLAKASLFRNKVAAWFLRLLGGYPINRGANDIQAVKTTIKYLKDGKKICIAPEGKRVKEGEIAEFKNGLVSFALKTNSYIVPIIFRKPTKIFTTNTILIGEPFKLSDDERFKDKRADKELLNTATGVLEEKMNYLKTVDIKEYKAFVNKS